MKQPKSSPREFMIRPAYSPMEDDRISFKLFDPATMKHTGWEHVIEKSAYDELKKERDQWREWAEKLSNMIDNCIESHGWDGNAFWAGSLGTNISPIIIDFAEFKKKMDAQGKK